MFLCFDIVSKKQKTKLLFTSATCHESKKIYTMENKIVWEKKGRNYFQSHSLGNNNLTFRLNVSIVRR